MKQIGFFYIEGLEAGGALREEMWVWEDGCLSMGQVPYFLGDPSHKPWKSTVMVRWFKVFVSLQFLNARLTVELVSLSSCLSFKRWTSEFVQLSSEFLPWSSMPLWGTNQSLLLILENPFSKLNCDQRQRCSSLSKWINIDRIAFGSSIRFEHLRPHYAYLPPQHWLKFVA